MTLQDSCSVCGSTRWLDVLESRGLVVHVGRLFATESEAINAPRGDVQLSLCESCGYIGNRLYRTIEDAFAPGYEASLHHSKVYVQFLSDLAVDLIERYGLRGKTALEVACGPGFFLRLMLQEGCGAGIGVDPSLDHNVAEAQEGKQLRWIRDFYDERYSDLSVDLVLCRQALHTMPEPRAMVESVRRAVADRTHVPIYFEVVNADNLFRKGIVWQLMYEYRSYFTVGSLVRLFRESGLYALRAGPCYVDGQYLSIEAAANPRKSNAASLESSFNGDAENPDDILRFADTFHAKVSYWQNRINEFRARKRNVIAWGAAGRGISFLNLTDPDRFIRYVAEINPARQGKFIPGSGAQVVAPESLVELKPDVIILTNATYENEVKLQVRGMGLNCEFVLA
jgi:SAM-dependent methyltransferase